MGDVIGFPRESVVGERRTLLTPQIGAALIRAGFEVVAEPGVGDGVFIDDAELSTVGVRFAAPDIVWRSGLILRYKSPDPADLMRLRPGQSIAALFHAEGDPRLLRALTETRVCAYSYEFLQESGQFPLAAPGGEIAGIQAVFYGALALQAHQGGRGVLIVATHGAPRARVLVIGSGNVGAAAARTAAALGAHVTVLAHSASSADSYRRQAPVGVEVLLNTGQIRTGQLAQADLVIGAILISTYDTPAMITGRDLSLMRPGAVIVDATCGYGPGYLPTAGPVQRPGQRSHIVAGIGHVRLDALPAQVPVTTTAAYTNRIGDYLVRLARTALHGDPDPVIDSARIATNGRLVHPVCQQHAEFYAHGDATQTASVVASYDQRAAYSRAENTTLTPPQCLTRMLSGRHHVVEVPCGSGYFLNLYAAAGVMVTLSDANQSMLDAAALHASTVGLRQPNTIVARVQQLRLPDDIDLVVIPNGAFNQLACQTTVIALAAALRAAISRPEVGVLAQILIDDGENLGRTSYFDPDLADDTWVQDRLLDPDAAQGARARHRRQHRHGRRVRLDFAYHGLDGRPVNETTVELELLTTATIVAAFEQAGFVDVHVEPGPGGFSELTAQTGDRS